MEEFGFTALAWAVQRGHAPVVAALLAGGADPNRPGPTGEPPLVTAARRGSPGCVRALLAHGARARSEALTEALAVPDTDTTALRDALAALLDDPDPEVVAEAARGLAVRQDPRAIAALERLLSESKPDSTSRATAEEAVEHIRDDRVRTLLASTLPRRI